MFDKMHTPLCLPRKTTSKPPKVLHTEIHTLHFFAPLNSKFALRPFDTSTSKSTPSFRYVLYLVSWKCASRRKGVQVFISHLARWPRTRCFNEPTFWPSWDTDHEKTSVLRLFYHLKGLHLLFSDCFSSVIFFLPLFSSLAFSSLAFSSLTLPTSAFHLSILWEGWLLNFLRLIYVYIFPTFSLTCFLAYALMSFLAFYLVCTLTFIFPGILFGIYWGMLSGMYSRVLSGIYADILLAFFLFWALPDLKRKRQISVGALLPHGWGPAVPSLELLVEVWWSSWYSAHWALKVAVEARSSRLRSGNAHWHLEFAAEVWSYRREKEGNRRRKQPC